jgi:hypothetical protein
LLVERRVRRVEQSAVIHAGVLESHVTLTIAGKQHAG